jgi:hypothetical protein
MRIALVALGLAGLLTPLPALAAPPSLTSPADAMVAAAGDASPALDVVADDSLRRILAGEAGLQDDVEVEPLTLVSRPLRLGGARSEGLFAPEAMPYFSWAEVWKDRGDPEEGILFQGYAEQAIDWFTVAGITVNTYAGVRWFESEKQDLAWANKASIWLGAKLKVPFALGDAFQGCVGAGLRHEGMKYSIDHPDRDRVLYYAEWWIGGDLQDLLGVGGGKGSRLRLPLTTYGLLSRANGDLELEEGLLLEAYAEGAIGWKVDEALALDAFGGSRWFESDRDGEPWNNKVSAIFGLRAEVRLPFFGGPTLVAGVRGERYWLTSTGDDDLFRWSIFFGWGFGGDLLAS